MSKKKRKAKKGKQEKQISVKQRQRKLSKDFKVIIQRRYISYTKKGKKKTRYEEIPREKFSRHKYYRIYMLHRKTNQKRLVAFGIFNDYPLERRNPNLPDYGSFLSGHQFEPTKKAPKKKGKWIPAKLIHRYLAKEIEQASKDRKVEARGIIVPPKNYFHPEWLIWSNRPLKGDYKLRKGVAISVLLEFIYPMEQWVSKRTIIVDFRNPVKVKNLHKYIRKWEREIEFKLPILYPNASRNDEVSIVEINGFVPLDFIPKGDITI